MIRVMAGTVMVTLLVTMVSVTAVTELDLHAPCYRCDEVRHLQQQQGAEGLFSPPHQQSHPAVKEQPPVSKTQPWQKMLLYAKPMYDQFNLRRISSPVAGENMGHLQTETLSSQESHLVKDHTFTNDKENTAILTISTRGTTHVKVTDTPALVKLQTDNVSHSVSAAKLLLRDENHSQMASHLKQSNRNHKRRRKHHSLLQVNEIDKQGLGQHKHKTRAAIKGKQPSVSLDGSVRHDHHKSHHHGLLHLSTGSGSKFWNKKRIYGEDKLSPAREEAGDASIAMQADQPFGEWGFPAKGSQNCPNCNCQPEEPRCKVGVNIVWDGCHCCHMCARQQGDLCSYNHRCDEEKKLYCDHELDPPRGICRARNGKPCNANGQLYKDGQSFNPNCSQQCTCQDGQYACTSACPQEDKVPSSIHCKHPRLVKIGGECCREWVCSQPRQLPVRPKGPKNGVSTVRNDCQEETSTWSSCSVSCGVGVSMRVTMSSDCKPLQEHRLCLVRPCDLDDSNMDGAECKSTWRKREKDYIVYGDCKSLQRYKLKYCSTCKKNKCCWPGRSKTIEVQLMCPSNMIITEKFMWMKSCECYKKNRCPFY